MNKLQMVADAILDSAADEFLEENLSSVDSVLNYAEGGMDIFLSIEEGERILNACRAYKDANPTSSNDYYHLITKALEEENV